MDQVPEQEQLAVRAQALEARGHLHEVTDVAAQVSAHEQAAVGRQPDGPPQADGLLAAMAITTDRPVSQAVVDEIVAGDGFVDGRTVAL